jgi:predicted phage replisome organizer
MADVKWIKITTDIFDDEKILLIESLPDSYAIITVWFKLLCLAGKQNNSGVFMLNEKIAYTDKMLATIFRMRESTVTMALKTFEEFGMIEIVDGVITIPNWGKHQSLDAYEKRKQRDRLYQAERRAAQRALAEKSADQSADKSADIASLEEDIDKDIDKDKKKSVRETTHTLFERLLPDFAISPMLADKLREWFKYKTERKEPYKEQGMKTLLRQIESHCSQYGDGALAALIDDSMANGWKGIIFDRLKKPTPNAQQPYQGGGRGRNVPPSGVDRILEMMERGDFDE